MVRVRAQLGGALALTHTFLTKLLIFFFFTLLFLSLRLFYGVIFLFWRGVQRDRSLWFLLFFIAFLLCYVQCSFVVVAALPANIHPRLLRSKLSKFDRFFCVLFCWVQLLQFARWIAAAMGGKKIDEDLYWTIIDCCVAQKKKSFTALHRAAALADFDLIHSSLFFYS